MSSPARKQASSQKQTSRESHNGFLLPPCFLTNNVETTAELNDRPLPCRLVFWNANNALENNEGIDELESSKTSYSKILEHILGKTPDTCKQESPNAASGRSGDNASETKGRLDQEVDILGHQISHDSFSELRDVTAVFMMRDKGGKLSPSHAAVLLCSLCDLDLPFVVYLAKDLQATLVSVDLEELEDSGWQFNYQEQRIIADNKLPETQPKKEPNRDCFVGMAVHYFGIQSKQHASKDAWNRSEKAIAAILDTQISKTRSNIVRENGPEAAAVISPESLVVFTGSYCTSIINTRLRRLQRWHIPHLFVPEVLKTFQPYSAWDLDDDEKYEFVEASQWAERDFQRAMTQITGRAFGTSHIDLKDVRIVLLRLGLLKTVRKTEEPDEREESSETQESKATEESNEGAPEDSGEMSTTDKITSDTDGITSKIEAGLDP
ncbi:hypothetical protein J3458_006945 [Metarhizium acridum]|uniref:uncharacterized protein n=1 Tax=Metarhizium acridum TaxID=92637 RepID=UPI001C6B23EF|nr:hypothetical protein J3458_006945 [Metarhizium acridum]